MKTLIKNIKELVLVNDDSKLLAKGKEMSELKTIKDAFLLIEDEFIADFGKMSELKENLEQDCEEFIEIDATGRMVFPSFCDSHTHLVYAGSREIEYSDKIKGLSYEDIAKRGGGILNSVKLLHETSEDELYEQSMMRIYEIISQGTGAVEIKSGYGLNTEDEIKILRVIKRIKETTPLIIRSTFMGAHAVPMEFKENPDDYVDLIINEMIPVVAAEELADFIDVFCDKGFFTVTQTDRILMAGMKHGMRAKIHANELANSGGIQVGVKYNSLSVDHIEYVGQDEIDALLDSETMPTILPGAAFFLNMPYSPARKMIEAGLPVAIASDFNPGSSPCGNMKLMMSFACVNYKMLPEEAIFAATLNSAYAMGVSDIVGSISRGKIANVFITHEIPTYQFLAYAYGSELIDTIILQGVIM
jgi:imidazolonepropionase